MRRTIPILSAATAALALVTVASCTTPATAEPTPTGPSITVHAEPESACGKIRMGYVVAPEGTPVEVHRSILAGGHATGWELQEPLPTYRVDIVPEGAEVTYKVMISSDVFAVSDPVTAHTCEPPLDPTGAPSTPSTSPTPSPSPSSSSDPEPSASAGSAAPSSPAPATKDSEGGLAATGVDR